MPQPKSKLLNVLEDARGNQQSKRKTEEKSLSEVKVIYSIPQQAKKQFDRLALDLDKTKKDAFREALNDFFKKYGKPEIA